MSLRSPRLWRRGNHLGGRRDPPSDPARERYSSCPALLARDPEALALRSAAPDAVRDVVLQRVVEALLADRTPFADPPRADDARAVTRVEHLRWPVAAGARLHPIVHDFTPSQFGSWAPARHRRGR